jgi:hypothetical protein
MFKEISSFSFSFGAENVRTEEESGQTQEDGTS